MDLIERTDQLKQRHPWEVARFHFFSRLVRQCRAGRAPFRILDVGAGDGWFSRQLARELGEGVEIVCWDNGYDDQVLASNEFHEHPSVRFVAEAPRERFDLVLLLDVLEHVEHDEPFLTQLVKNNLEAGGHLLLSVPAWPILFSAHDSHLRHHRRYTPAQCQAVLAAAGLVPLESAGLFHSLFAVRLLQKVFAPPSGAPPDLGQWRAPAAVTAAILNALKLESAISRVASRLPLYVPGLSHWALCRAR